MKPPFKTQPWTYQESWSLFVTWRIPQSSPFCLVVNTAAPFTFTTFDWKIRISLSDYELTKKWITQTFGLRISFLYTPGALWSWNLHVDRALGVMDNAVWAGGVTSGVDSHIGPHWQNFYNFVNAASKGLGTRRQRSAFPYLLQKNFPSKIFQVIHAKCHGLNLHWAALFSISTEQRVISTGMVNEFGEKPERKNTAPFGPRILRMISQNLSIVPWNWSKH